MVHDAGGGGEEWRIVAALQQRGPYLRATMGGKGGWGGDSDDGRCSSC
jgi:hypothetical protein